MKITLMTAAALLAAGGAAQASDSARHEAESINKASVALTQAIQTAETRGNGQAISAEYEFKRGNPAYYEIKVLRADGEKLTKYELSPVNGKVKEVSDEKFEKLFTLIKPAAIQKSPTSLSHAIATAEAKSGGKATEADVDRDGDQVQYTVKVVRLDGSSEKIKINGSDGKIVAAK